MQEFRISRILILDLQISFTQNRSKPYFSFKSSEASNLLILGEERTNMLRMEGIHLLYFIILIELHDAVFYSIFSQSWEIFSRSGLVTL